MRLIYIVIAFFAGAVTGYYFSQYYNISTATGAGQSGDHGPGPAPPPGPGGRGS